MTADNAASKEIAIVTSFLVHDSRILVLRRSGKSRTMPHRWSGISGIMEGDEDPLYRARQEIVEETGIRDAQLLGSADPLNVTSKTHERGAWCIVPFLFCANSYDVRLNHENSDYAWIYPDEISKYDTVPELARVLCALGHLMPET